MTAIRTSLLTVVPPILGAAISIPILLSLDLPEPIAVHWGPDGIDQFATVSDLVVPIAVFVPLTALVMLAILQFGTRGARAPYFGRFVVALSSFIGLGIAFVPLAIAVPQVGVADPGTVPVGVPIVSTLLVFVVAAVIGIGLSLLAPRMARSVIEGTDATALALGDSERASWTRSVGPARGAIVVLAGSAVVVVVTLAIAGAPILVALPVLVLLALVGGLLFWRVTVDARGVTVRSLLGVPRFRVDPAGVVDARAIVVDPFRQFGGWGIRYSAIGWGVVVRGGAAIEVNREGRSPFIVTVDDAETGAALLTAIARRARNPHSSI
jgi:hypothetical protein